VESNLTLVTEIDHNPQKTKQAFFHQYICPDCGFVALTKPFEEGEEPESIVSFSHNKE
jgi:hypothetical protein